MSRIVGRSAFLAGGLALGMALPPGAARAQADYTLPESAAQALAMEARDALPLIRFYDPPTPLKPAPPGTLIRSQPTAGYTCPPARTPCASCITRGP